MNRLQLIAGLAGASAVALGAFGAHGLEERLARLDPKHLWQTAGLYHLLHAVALLVVTYRTAPSPRARAICIAWVIGMIGFSGALYLRAVGGPRWLGMVAPIGGASFIVGWFLAGWDRLRSSP